MPVSVTLPTTIPAPPGAHGVTVTSVVPLEFSILVDEEPIGLMVPKSSVGVHLRFWHFGLVAQAGSVQSGMASLHMCGLQPGKSTHAGSAQSMRPLSSSSMPLLQISVPRTRQRGSPTH